MLKISRNDVECDRLTEFPVQERFIKLPIANYLKLLDIEETTNRAQIALINAANNPKYRFICAALARRLGKTFIANVIAQLVSLVPDSHVLLIAPNYSLSSISFDLQRSLIRKFDIEVDRDNLKDKVIELSNGSSVRMGSMSTVDSTVGRSYSLILFDEAALCTDGDEAFNIQLLPTLDKLGSKAIFITTPRGMKNWFSLFYNRGYSNEFPNWVSIQADYKENPRMTDEVVAQAKASMSEAEFRQEFCADFAVFEGQIYKLNPECVVEYVEKEGVEYFAGLDVGAKDPTALCVIAFYTVDGVDYYHVVDEYMAVGTTDKHAAEIQEMIDKWGLELIFIDTAAKQTAIDLTYIYDIPIQPAKKAVISGISFIQNIVESNRLLVAPHCTNTLDAIDQYKWDENKEKPDHHYSDMMDAMRYGIYSFMV